MPFDYNQAKQIINNASLNNSQQINNSNNGSSIYQNFRNNHQVIQNNNNYPKTVLDNTNSREMNAIEATLANIGKTGEEIMNIGGFNQEYAKKKQQAASENREMNIGEYASLVPNFAASLVPMMVGGLIEDVPRTAEMITGQNYLDADTETNRISNTELTAEQRLADAGYLAGDFLSWIPAAGVAGAAGKLAKAGVVAEKEAAKYGVKQAAATIGASALEEGAAEAFQQPMEEIRGDLNTFGVDSVDWEGLPGRALEAGAWGALGGGMFGGVNATMSYATNKTNSNNDGSSGVSNVDQNDTSIEEKAYRDTTPSSDTLTSYSKKELSSQYDENRAPGASATVLAGNEWNGIRHLDDWRFGIIGLRGMLQNQDSRQSTIELLNEIGAKENDLINNERSSTEAYYNREKEIADYLTDLVQKKGGIETIIGKNPHNVRGLVRGKLVGFSTGNNIYCHRNAIKSLNSDFDGDMTQIYLFSAKNRHEDNILDKVKYASQKMSDNILKNDVAGIEEYFGGIDYKSTISNIEKILGNNKQGFEFYKKNLEALLETNEDERDAKIEELKKDKSNKTVHESLGSWIAALDSDNLLKINTNQILESFGSSHSRQVVLDAIKDFTNTFPNVNTGTKEFEEFAENLIKDSGFVNREATPAQWLSMIGLPINSEFEKAYAFRAIQAYFFQSTRGSVNREFDLNSEKVNIWVSAWFGMVGPGMKSAETIRSEFNSLMFQEAKMYIEQVGYITDNESLDGFKRHMADAHNTFAKEINKEWNKRINPDGIGHDSTNDLIETATSESIMNELPSMMSGMTLSEVFGSANVGEDLRSYSINSLASIARRKSNSFSSISLIPELKTSSDIVRRFANEIDIASKSKTNKRGLRTMNLIKSIGDDLIKIMSNEYLDEHGNIKIQFKAQIDFLISAFQNILSKNTAYNQNITSYTDIIDKSNDIVSGLISNDVNDRYNAVVTSEIRERFRDIYEYEEELKKEDINEVTRKRINDLLILKSEEVSSINELYSFLSNLRRKNKDDFNKFLSMDVSFSEKIRIVSRYSITLEDFDAATFIAQSTELIGESDMSTASTRLTESESWMQLANENDYFKNLEEVKNIEEYFNSKEFNKENMPQISNLLKRIFYKQMIADRATNARDAAQNAWAVQKSQSDKGLNPVYPTAQWAEINLGKHGFIYSFKDQLTGLPFGVITEKILMQNPLIKMAAWCDPTFEVEVQSGTSSRTLSREELFKDYGINLNGKEPTNEQWLQVFRSNPNIITYLGHLKAEACDIGTATSARFYQDKSLLQCFKDEIAENKTANGNNAKKIERSIKYVISSHSEYYRLVPLFMDFSKIHGVMDSYNYKKQFDKAEDFIVKTLTKYFVLSKSNDQVALTNFRNEILQKFPADISNSLELLSTLENINNTLYYGERENVNFLDIDSLILKQLADEEFEHITSKIKDKEKFDGEIGLTDEEIENLAKNIYDKFKNNLFSDMSIISDFIFNENYLTEVNGVYKKNESTNKLEKFISYINEYSEFLKNKISNEYSNNTDVKDRLTNLVDVIKERYENIASSKEEVTYVEHSFEIGSDFCVAPMYSNKTFERNRAECIDKLKAAISNINKRYQFVDLDTDKFNKRIADIKTANDFNKIAREVNVRVYRQNVLDIAPGFPKFNENILQTSLDAIECMKNLFGIVESDETRLDKIGDININLDNYIIDDTVRFNGYSTDAAYNSIICGQTVATGNVSPGVNADNIPNQIDLGYGAISNNQNCGDFEAGKTVIKNGETLGAEYDQQFIGIPVGNDGTINYYVIDPALRIRFNSGRIKDILKGNPRIVQKNGKAIKDEYPILNPVEHSKTCSCCGCVLSHKGSFIKAEKDYWHPLRSIIQTLSDACEGREIKRKKSLDGVGDLDNQIGDLLSEKTIAFHRRCTTDFKSCIKNGYIDSIIFNQAFYGIRQDMENTLNSIFEDKNTGVKKFTNFGEEEAACLASSLCQRIALYDNDSNGVLISAYDLMNFNTDINGNYILPDEYSSYTNIKAVPFSITSLGGYISEVIQSDVIANPEKYKDKSNPKYYEKLVSESLKHLRGTYGKEGLSFSKSDLESRMVRTKSSRDMAYDYSSGIKTLYKLYTDTKPSIQSCNGNSVSEITTKQNFNNIEKVLKNNFTYSSTKEVIPIKVFNENKESAVLNRVKNSINGIREINSSVDYFDANSDFAAIVGSESDLASAIKWSFKTNSCLIIPRSVYENATNRMLNLFKHIGTASYNVNDINSTEDYRDLIIVQPAATEKILGDISHNLRPGVSAINFDNIYIEILAETNLVRNADSFQYTSHEAALKMRKDTDHSYRVNIDGAKINGDIYSTEVLSPAEFDSFLMRAEDGTVYDSTWAENNPDKVIEFYKNKGVILTEATETIGEGKVSGKGLTPRNAAIATFKFFERACKKNQYNKDRSCLNGVCAKNDCVSMIKINLANDKHVYYPAIALGTGPQVFENPRMVMDNGGSLNWNINISITDETVFATETEDGTKITNFMGSPNKAMSIVLPKEFDNLMPTIGKTENSDGAGTVYGKDYYLRVSGFADKKIYDSGSRATNQEMIDQDDIETLSLFKLLLGGNLFIKRDGNVWKIADGLSDELRKSIPKMYSPNGIDAIKEFMSINGNNPVIKFFKDTEPDANLNNKILTNVFRTAYSINPNCLLDLISSYTFEYNSATDSFSAKKVRNNHIPMQSVLRGLTRGQVNTFFNMYNLNDSGKKICTKYDETFDSSIHILNDKCEMWTQIPYINDTEEQGITKSNVELKPAEFVKVSATLKTTGIEDTRDMPNSGSAGLSYQHISKAGWEYGFTEDSFQNAMGYLGVKTERYATAITDRALKKKKKLRKISELGKLSDEQWAQKYTEWFPNVSTEKIRNVISDRPYTKREKQAILDELKASRIYSEGVKIVLPDGTLASAKQLSRCVDRINSALGLTVGDKKISLRDIQKYLIPNMLGITYNENREAKIFLNDFEDITNEIVDGLKRDKPVLIPAYVKRDSISESWGERYSIPYLPQDISEYFYNISPRLQDSYACFENFLKESANEWNTQYTERIQRIEDEKKRKELLKLIRWAKRTTTRDIELTASETLYADEYFVDLVKHEEDLLKSLYGFSDIDIEFMKKELKRTRLEMERIKRKSEKKNMSEYVDDDGETHVTFKSKKYDYMTAFFKNSSALSKIMAVLNPMIAVANTTERTVSTSIMNACLYTNYLGNIGPYKFSNKYRIKEKQLEMVRFACSNKNAKKLFGNIRFLIITGYSGGIPTSNAELSAIAERHAESQNRLGHLEEEIWNLASGKDFGIELQMNAFLNQYIRRIGLEAEKGNELAKQWFEPAGGFETKLEYMMQNNPEQLFEEIMLSLGNRRIMDLSLEWSRGADMARKTSFGMIYNEIAKEHAFFEFMMTTNVSRFVQYQSNLLERMMQFVFPVSSVRFLWNKTLSSLDIPLIGTNVKLSDLNIESAQIHGNLKEAIMVDACHISAGFMAAMLVAMSGAIEPPDDDDKWCNPQEWTILGMRVSENWWLSDLLGPIKGMCCFMKSVELGKPNINVLVNDLTDSLYSNPMLKIGDVLQELTNPWESAMSKYYDDVDSYSGLKLADITPVDALTSDAAAYGVSWLTQFVTPSAIKQIYNDMQEYEVSYKKIAKTDQYGNVVYNSDGTVAYENTTYYDAQIRKISRKNPILGFFMNTFINPDAPTGYMAHEMPRTVYYDPYQIESLQNYSLYYTDEYGNKVVKSEEECQAIAMSAIALMMQYDDMSELTATGFCLPYDTLQYIADNVWDLAYSGSDEWNNYVNSIDFDYSALGDGDIELGKERAEAIQNSVNQNYNFWSNFYYDKLKSEAITAGIATYNRYNTTYAKDENGNWYATGFRPSYFMPVVVAPGTTTDNAETMGYSNDWATQSIVTGRSTEQRALIPNLETYDLGKFESHSSDGNGNGYSKSYSSRSSSGGYSRSSGGRSYGGGSSYSRRATNPGTINPQDANIVYKSHGGKQYGYNTMNPQKTYEAQLDYLKPNFETKGSRKAYRRSDF